MPKTAKTALGRSLPLASERGAIKTNRFLGDACFIKRIGPPQPREGFGVAALSAQNAR